MYSAETGLTMFLQFTDQVGTLKQKGSVNRIDH
jgi:hypothetical protein